MGIEYKNEVVFESLMEVYRGFKIALEHDSNEYLFPYNTELTLKS